MSIYHFPYQTESDFENVLFKKRILENCDIIEYKSNISSTIFMRKHADAIIIDKNNKYWGICEIEVSTHSIKNHVFPQLVQIYNLIENNRRDITQDIIQSIETKLNIDQRNLILQNKPYLFLITDYFPQLYANLIPLLNTFCNVLTCKRYKDKLENYTYIVDEYYVNDLKYHQSRAICNGKMIIVLNPNHIENIYSTKILYSKGEPLKIISTEIVQIQEIQHLVIILQKQITPGEYNLIKRNNKLLIENGK